jgi:hypothetical protein
MSAEFFGDFYGDGTGVRLLLGDAVARQKIDDGFCLDLELTGQLIDSYLICVGHAIFRI